MRKTVLIYNPRAGRWQAPARLCEIVAALGDGGYNVEVVPTRAPGDATRIAAAAARDDADIVFSLGGDGTQRETAAGLLGSNVPLAPLPAGTGNVIARALGIPADPLNAIRALKRASVRSHRIGLCSGEPFVMQASTGLDAQVLANIRPAIKRLLGQGGVTLATLREWWRYDYPEIRLSANGRQFRASFCAACNIPQYGPFRLAPEEYDDDKLPVVLFEGRGRRRTLAFALDLVRGRHLRRADVRVEQAATLDILGPADLQLQLDGCLTELRPPVRIELAPNKLRVLSP